MHRHAIITATLALCLTFTVLAREKQSAAGPAAVQDGIAVYFSPKGGCTDAIVARIEAARKTIDVQAYSFTSTAIAGALADAQVRGVKVRIILDKSNKERKYGAPAFVAERGVAVFIDPKHGIAHNKVMILDGATVITGSFNFTKQAEDGNAENLLIIEGKPKLAAAYARNFEDHLRHSNAYTMPDR